MERYNCTCHCGGSMFYKHLHDPSCDLFMRGEEAPQSKEAQLQAALDAEREKVAAYDKWLSGGVYFTTEEYKDLVANHNQQLATLQAQLRQVEGDRQTLRQLVEALINTWVNGRKIHDGIPLTLRQQIDATLAAKDAGKEVPSA